MRVFIVVLLGFVTLATSAATSQECESYLKTISTIKQTRYFIAPSKEEVENMEKKLNEAKTAYEKGGCEKTLVEEEKTSRCKRTGCSGQICSAEDSVSTCEWREEYACYRSAFCGGYGRDNECQFLYTPQYFECLEKGM